MCELKKKNIGKVFTSKFVGIGPSSFEKRIYRVAVSHRLRSTGIETSTVRQPRPDLGYIATAKRTSTLYTSSWRVA